MDALRTPVLISRLVLTALSFQVGFIYAAKVSFLAEVKGNVDQSGVEGIVNSLKNKCSDCEISEMHVSDMKVLRITGPESIGKDLGKDKQIFDVEVEHNYLPAGCTTQNNAPWGLERTSERELDIDGDYTYSDTDLGQGVDIYILDSGIRSTHREFKPLTGPPTSRVQWGLDLYDYLEAETDVFGHGTSVASVALGRDLGLAKQANGIAVRVTNEVGIGTTSSLVEGIGWVVDEHNSKVDPKSIINMSLVGPRSRIIGKAVEKAIDAGVLVVSSAGNNQDKACSYSPANAKGGITVGCTLINDTFCDFSNFGRCVTILAPGFDIEAAFIRSDNDEILTSGTSFSSPHVAGILAKYIGSQPGPVSQSAAIQWLEDNATMDEISSVPKQTPNALAFIDC
ncbi:uncharacterized protein LOC141912941 [Tubulanus polymorphus]|uniref:uncharacterized protein LOC141912941 n=1 Tax=Tubulanus polymorphus TaxID=672921 RepID=UPI003DA5A24F